MAADLPEDALLASAVSGDKDATGRILWAYYERLLGHIAPQIPHSLRPSIDADDILEEAFVHVWRHIQDFQPQGPGSFYAWLKKIAQRTLLDKIKARRTEKRGGGREPAEFRQRDDSSLASLLELVAADTHTPSSSAARREAERALRVALAGLPEHYQQVVGLRYLRGFSIPDVAARMGRTEAAVQMLCQRALRKLHDAMGSASKYLSSRE